MIQILSKLLKRKSDFNMLKDKYVLPNRYGDLVQLVKQDGNLYLLDGELILSKANAIIEGTSGYAGGLVGAAYTWMPSITACYSQGQIIGKIGTNSTGSQGILGYVSGSCPIDYCYTLYNSTLNESESFSIYDLVSQFSSPINIAEIMRANCSSEASEYWDFNRTWTWKGTANGKTVTAICPKLKWEK